MPLLVEGWWEKSWGDTAPACWAPLSYEGPCAKRQTGVARMSTAEKQDMQRQPWLQVGRDGVLSAAQDFELNCDVRVLTAFRQWKNFVPSIFLAGWRPC